MALPLGALLTLAASACMQGEDSAIDGRRATHASDAEPALPGSALEEPAAEDDIEGSDAGSSDAGTALASGPTWAPPHHAALPLQPLGDGLHAYLPHRPGAHRLKGSGHTHSAPDHSDISPRAQEERLRDLPGPHAHGFVWLTGHNFVAPDPGVSGIQHMFGIEAYSAKQPQSGVEPHVLAYLPDGALADPSERPLGYFEHDINEINALVQDVGGVTAWAHPSRQPLTDEELASIDGLWGMEVVSGATDVEANLAFVDRRLGMGHYVCLTGGGDTHAEDYRLTRGYQLVEVQSAEPTREELFTEVAACNFFVCETKDTDVDPIEPPRLSVEGNHLTVTLPRAADSIRFIGDGGAVLSETRDADTASYAPRRADRYVRVEIRAEAGQAACYSQPTWLVDDADVHDGAVDDGDVDDGDPEGDSPVR
ncbi:MAG: hypothetical protein GX607_22545 [Myxococcales bacterium]|nr:hypothetical protein [Myxococcales bacterium]